MMWAVVRTEYGSPDVVRLEQVPRPTPGDSEVLIRVVAASINGSDREGIAGSPAYTRIGGLRRPRHRILGSDIAGRVEHVGRDVLDLRPGDEVLGEAPGYHSGFAEYVCAPEGTFVRKPSALSFAEAAAIPQAAAIAVRGIRMKGRVRPGQHVLINGAAGAAGSFAVQLAKLDGAEVTCVDHRDKGDFLRSLGADHVLDYTTQDFTAKPEQYDLILDTMADRSVLAYARALRPNGAYFFAGGALKVLFGALLLGPWLRVTTRKRIAVLMVPQDRQVLMAAADLCAKRRMTPVIDRSYPFQEAREALRYVSEGRQRGKVVITFET